MCHMIGFGTAPSIGVSCREGEMCHSNGIGRQLVVEILISQLDQPHDAIKQLRRSLILTPCTEWEQGLYLLQQKENGDSRSGSNIPIDNSISLPLLVRWPSTETVVPMANALDATPPVVAADSSLLPHVPPALKRKIWLGRPLLGSPASHCLNDSVLSTWQLKCGDAKRDSASDHIIFGGLLMLVLRTPTAIATIAAALLSKVPSALTVAAIVSSPLPDRKIWLSVSCPCLSLQQSTRS